MSFPETNNGRVYNNADSFGMAFDDAWKNLTSEDKEITFNKEQKIKLVMEKLKEHPFLLQFPAEAEKVAEFRVRLLGLD